MLTTEVTHKDTETGVHKVSLPSEMSSIKCSLESMVYTECRETDTVAIYKGASLYALEVTNTNMSTLLKPYDDPKTYY